MIHNHKILVWLESPNKRLVVERAVKINKPARTKLFKVALPGKKRF